MLPCPLDARIPVLQLPIKTLLGCIRDHCISSSDFIHTYINTRAFMARMVKISSVITLVSLYGIGFPEMERSTYH